MAGAVRVLAADFLAGHIEDQEIALRRERHVLREFTGRQAAAQISTADCSRCSVTPGTDGAAWSRAPCAPAAMLADLVGLLLAST